MERLTLTIDGMSCSHCLGAVTRALQGLDGVRIDRVAIGSATVEIDPARTDAQAVTTAIEDAGYQAHVAGR
jgi:copper chaperone